MTFCGCFQIASCDWLLVASGHINPGGGGGGGKEGSAAFLQLCWHEANQSGNQDFSTSAFYKYNEDFS